MVRHLKLIRTDTTLDLSQKAEKVGGEAGAFQSARMDQGEYAVGAPHSMCPPSNAAHHPSVCRGVSPTPPAYARCSNEWPLRHLWITPKNWAATVPGMGWGLEPGFAGSFKSREEKMVGRRASASLHHYQKFSCVLAPIGDQHYSAAARSASCSSRIVGLPA